MLKRKKKELNKMSKLNDLIQELCPDGVEYKNMDMMIKEKILILISPSIKVKKNNFLQQGHVPIVSQELEYISGYTNIIDKKISKDEYVCFGDHSEHIKYVDFQFVQGADGLKIISVRNKDIISAKYLYYALCNFYERYNTYERHFKYLKKLPIPVPPLLVQREIVRILDNFTELEAELETEIRAELTARKKQYEYYRDKLLSFSNINGGGTQA